MLRGFGWLLQRVKMMEKLWGDNFFDPSTKKWTKKAHRHRQLQARLCAVCVRAHQDHHRCLHERQ